MLLQFMLILSASGYGSLSRINIPFEEIYPNQSVKKEKINQGIFPGYVLLSPYAQFEV
jgi:hypothetical protein